MSTEVEQATIPEGTPTLPERVDALSESAKSHYDLTGDIDAAEAVQGGPRTKPDVSADSSPAAAAPTGETEGAPAPPDEAPQPRKRDRSNRDWRNEVVRVKDDQIAGLKAQLERYERESAERRTPAPSTIEPQDSYQGPQLPTFDQFNGQADAAQKWQEAMRQWVVDHDKWRDQQHSQARAVESLDNHWTQQKEASRTKYKDFDAVAFSDNTPASFSSIPRLQAHPMAGEIAYYLGQHKDEASRIALLTNIPGTDTKEKYAQFLKDSMTNRDALIAKVRAETLADAEFNRIAALLSRPAASSQPAPRPKPSSEVRVNANGRGIVGNDKADALARGDYALYERIANEEDIRGRRR
jgi:hypothetical protein